MNAFLCASHGNMEIEQPDGESDVIRTVEVILKWDTQI